MRDKKYLWLGLTFIAIALMLLFCLIFMGCSLSDINLELGDYVTAVEHDNGQVEVRLICINQSTVIAYDVVADVSIEHNETKELFDRIVVEIGDVLPGEEKEFSVWTDKVKPGADIGVSVIFTCKRK